MQLSKDIRDTLDTAVTAAIQAGSEDFTSILRAVFDSSQHLNNAVPMGKRMHVIDATLRRLKRKGVVAYRGQKHGWRVVGREARA